jgi:alpha-glucosidase (family GH31 glycosyl hydrolase)
MNWHRLSLLRLARLPFLLAPAMLLCALSQPCAASTRVTKDTDGVTIQVQPGILRLQVWGDRILRFTCSPGDHLPARASFAVLGKPAVVKWELTETPEVVILQTPAMQARVDRKSGAVVFCDASGVSFLREVEDGRTFATTTIAGKPVVGAAQKFTLAEGEAIYGLGQHQDCAMNRVGTSVRLLQENRSVSVPVLLSSKGYGLFWDNPAVTEVDVAKSSPGVIQWSSEAGDSIDYYVFYGPEPDRVIAGYRTITGTVPMFPRWAWGLWQSRERYKTQEELLGVAREYRRRNIPLDGMVQDWQYWIPQPWGSHAFGVKVYLPGRAAWTDFDTGKQIPAGEVADMPTPLDTLPLLVRAGSIIPLGPAVQSAAEKCDPIELRVYRGADGAFTLYDDDGETNQYERGMHATVPISWNEAKQALTIGARQGSFPTMLKEHDFHVVFVSEGHGVGGSDTERPDRVVGYDGQTVQIRADK